MKNKKTLTTLKEYLIITFGMFLYCFSWTSFLIPHGIAGGGVTGMATVIHFATKGLIPVSALYLVINLLLVMLGTWILGKGFGFKTIYCIILATLLFQFLPTLIPWVSDVKEAFLNAVLGGSLGGVGIAVIFTQGGSTGGTDIIALIISKYREVSPGRVFLMCDLVIIGSIIFLPDKSVSDVIYGYLQMVSFSYTLDVILTGTKQSVQILIFSSKYKEIADVMVKDLGRGVTVFEGMGWYTQDHKNILMVITRKNQISEVTKAIKQIDNKAFISITSAMGVYGNGFEQIKSGGKIEWKKGTKKSSKESKTMS